MKKKIAVLFGGCSAEYSISLASAHSVLTHMDHEKYEVIAIGITKDGRWFRYLGPYAGIADDTWHKDGRFCRPAFLSPDRQIHGLCEICDGLLSFTYLDAAFPVLHGRNGEDGTIQGLIEMAGIPLIGCDTMSSALSMDKYRAHILAEYAGVRTPKSIHLSGYPSAEELKAMVSELTFPLFVKPLRAGSSFGITRVTAEEALQEAITLAFSYDREIIIEEGIEGFEVGCAVLGTHTLILGQVDEIELSGGFFDFEEKYHRQTAKIHMPARISEETEHRIQQAAEKIYRILGCSGFARVDLFLTPSGEIVFNEINTIPGFTSVSRYPNMLKGVGLEYTDIIECLLSSVL